MRLAWCNYDGEYWRQIPHEVCEWHRYGGHGNYKPDPKCKNCEERGGELMFDLKRLGQLVIKNGIPHDKVVFDMDKIQIEMLGKCFMETRIANDQKEESFKDDGKIPF
jgi:hypothetical protein